MNNADFEILWQQNRDKILANDDEYQRTIKSYTSWNWADYVILIGGFVICEQFSTQLQLSNIILQYLISLVGMAAIWLGYRLIKSRLGGKTTLEELEKNIKERYRKTLK